MCLTATMHCKLSISCGIRVGTASFIRQTHNQQQAQHTIKHTNAYRFGNSPSMSLPWLVGSAVPLISAACRPASPHESGRPSPLLLSAQPTATESHCSVSSVVHSCVCNLYKEGTCTRTVIYFQEEAQEGKSGRQNVVVRTPYQVLLPHRQH